MLPRNPYLKGPQSRHKRAGFPTHILPVSCGLPVGLGNSCALAKFVSGAFDLIFHVSLVGPEESEREGGLPGQRGSGKGVCVWRPSGSQTPQTSVACSSHIKSTASGQSIIACHYFVTPKGSKRLLLSERGDGHRKKCGTVNPTVRCVHRTQCCL